MTRIDSALVFRFTLLILAGLLSACQTNSPAASWFVPPASTTSNLIAPSHLASQTSLSLTSTITPNPLSPTSTPVPYPISPTSSPIQSTGINLPESQHLLPDSELVFSPSAAAFDVAAYLRGTRGWLKTHREYLKSTAWTSAAEIISRVARENSINPRILLSLLEYECGCVTGQPSSQVQADFLLGNTDFRRKGLFRQLSWAASRLSTGYYGWRSGTLREFPVADGIIHRPAPSLNAGSVAVQYFFAFYEDESMWNLAADIEPLLKSYKRLFGDPWQHAQAYEPLLPRGLTQPPLILPFETGRLWAFTSGPHTVWEKTGAQAALDFAPATHESGCIPTDAWVVAMANGPVVRVEFGAVIQDLDDPQGDLSDGVEQTGWSILYMHIEERDRVAPGTYLHTGDRIGHPSCEGGRTTGTHVHVARKYNGEWVAAVGPIPFTLDGWVAHAGQKSYQGTLTRAGQTVVAHPYGSFETRITRPTPAPSPTHDEP